MDRPATITQLLNRMTSSNDERVWGDLVPLVYDELKDIAHLQLLRMRSGETFSTTALVHEAYLKLSKSQDAVFMDLGHFFGVASRAMRHILVDYAKRKSRIKRGGGQEVLPLLEGLIASEQKADEILAVDDALDQLRHLDDRQHRVVELRYFMGLSIDETAHVLEVSPATVKREWRIARAWLHKTIAAG